MKFVKTPLRYPGGKSRAIEQIAPLIPNFKEYREPFIGGGSVYFYIRQKYPDKEYWVNDLNYELYNFWRKSQEDVDVVIEHTLQWKKKFSNGKELFRYLRMNMNLFNEVEKACAYFILNHLAFSGCTLVGGYSEHSYKTGFTESNIKELIDIKNVLQGTKITNFDYQKVVDAATIHKDEDIFIFLDPPYYSATGSGLYGKGGKSLFGISMRNLHRQFDHLRFAEVMKRCKCKYLITYDDSPFIRKLFSFAYIIPWNLTYGMRQYNNVGKELFISNYIENIPGKDTTNQIDIESAWG